MRFLFILQQYKNLLQYKKSKHLLSLLVGHFILLKIFLCQKKGEKFLHQKVILLLYFKEMFGHPNYSLHFNFFQVEWVLDF